MHCYTFLANLKMLHPRKMLVISNLLVVVIFAATAAAFTTPAQVAYMTYHTLWGIVLSCCPAFKRVCKVLLLTTKPLALVRDSHAVSVFPVARSPSCSAVIVMRSAARQARCRERNMPLLSLLPHTCCNTHLK